MRRTRNDSFIRVSLVSFLYFASLSSAFSPTLALCAKARGAGNLEIGLLYAFSGLLGTIVRLPSGSLSNLWGRRPFVLLGGLSCVVSPIIFALSTTRQSLWIGCAAYGLAFLYAPSALSLMHDSLADEKKAKLLSFYTISGGVGRAIGPILAGALLQWRHSYEEVFMGSMFLAVAGFLISMALHDERSEEVCKPQLIQGHVSHHVWDETFLILKKPVLFASVLLRFFQSIAMGIFNAYFPLLAMGMAGLAPGAIGLSQGAMILSSLASRGIISRKNHSLKKLLGIQWGATAGCGLSLVAMGHGTGFLVILLSCAMLGFADGLSHVANLIFVSKVVAKNLFSPAISIHSSSSDMGLMCGRTLPGLTMVALSVGFSTGFLLFGAVVFLCSGISMIRICRLKNWGF